MSSVGIDFGTTNSVVSVFSGGTTDVLPIDTPPGDWAELGFDRVLPSVLGIAGDRPTFGWAAKRQQANKLEAVKRLFATEESVEIGGMTYSVELAAAMLFARLKEGAEATGATVERAVVTIPANSRGLARYRTKLCAGLAGIKVAALINEPTAAAMAHSVSASSDRNILVFDWGGGTLDVTVLETVAGVFIERASKGIQRSGGIDLDHLFGAAILSEIPDATAWDAPTRDTFAMDVERAKVVLSTATETHIQLPGGRQLPVTREQLERAIRPKIEETRGPIDQCLRDLGISPEAVDEVVLVGGSSKIPAVRQFVSEILGQDPMDGVDPMTAVSQGAAVASAILANELDADFFVGTEHALGTISTDESGQSHFSVLIGRNHHLPAKEREQYVPVQEGTESVKIRVIEGEPELPLDHPDNVILKEWDVDVDPNAPRQDNAFTMTYEYDVDGILHVLVTNDATGDVMLRDDLSFGVSKDKRGLVDLAQNVQAMMAGQVAAGDAASPAVPVRELDPVTRELVDQIRQKIAPFVDDDEAARLNAICVDLENAEGDAVAECQSVLQSELSKYAYLL